MKRVLVSSLNIAIGLMTLATAIQWLLIVVALGKRMDISKVVRIEWGPSGKEGTSRELLAVTWMNESGFELRPSQNDNGHPENVDKWDVGPFQINVHWTLAQVAKKEVSFGGLNERNVFGYDFYHSDGTTPLNYFTGDPLSNGRMGARRLNAIGGSDENKAIKYTKPASQAARKTSYESYAGRFRDFFNCYHPH